MPSAVPWSVIWPAFSLPWLVKVAPGNAVDGPSRRKPPALPSEFWPPVPAPPTAQVVAHPSAEAGGTANASEATIAAPKGVMANRRIQSLLGRLPVRLGQNSTVSFH